MTNEPFQSRYVCRLKCEIDNSQMKIYLLPILALKKLFELNNYFEET